jgi:AcrR family transcriptional regulator
MELIADAAGVARRTLYNQFPDGKESIFRAAVEDFWAKFPEVQLMSNEEFLANPRKGMTRIGDAITEFWKTEASVLFLRLAASEHKDFPDIAERFFPDGKLPLMNEMIAYFNALKKNGILNISDVELAMRHFFGLVNEPTLWLRVIGAETVKTASFRTKAVEAAVYVFLRAYGTSKLKEFWR